MGQKVHPTGFRLGVVKKHNLKKLKILREIEN